MTEETKMKIAKFIYTKVPIGFLAALFFGALIIAGLKALLFIAAAAVFIAVAVAIAIGGAFVYEKAHEYANLQDKGERKIFTPLGIIARLGSYAGHIFITLLLIFLFGVPFGVWGIIAVTICIEAYMLWHWSEQVYFWRNENYY